MGQPPGLLRPPVSWNFLNYGRLINQVRVQDARFQELLITYQNTVLSAQQDVEDNLTAFLRTQEQAAYLAESAEAAQNSLNLAVIQYREGITDFTTVLTAQQALLTDQDSLATALGNIASSLVGVYRSIGGGWEIREGHNFVDEETRAADGDAHQLGQIADSAQRAAAHARRGAAQDLHQTAAILMAGILEAGPWRVRDDST